MARSVFGDAIDFGPMRFRLGKWWALQPAWITMSPDGHIWLHPNGGLWREDYSSEALWLRGHIVHELTHVWQHQQGVHLPSRRHPFSRYGYRFEPGRRFERYGIEQQAELVRHAYMQKEGARLEGRPSLAQLEEVLPFGPGGPDLRAV